VLAAFHGLFAGGQELLRWDDTTNLVDNEGYQGLSAAPGIEAAVSSKYAGRGVRLSVE
jgi:hypothetical protein